MAPREAAQRKPPSFEPAMSSERFQRIGAAGRIKAAISPDKGRKQQAIPSHWQ